MNYNPAHLPDINAIEIVNLKGLEPNKVSQYMETAVSAPYVEVTGKLT